eukprot:Opistho-1_new@909
MSTDDVAAGCCCFPGLFAARRALSKGMSAPKSRKFAVMGFRAVGKSSLTIQFVEGQFVDSYHPTIENTFQKLIRYKGQDYTADIVDTAGEDEFSILPSRYSVGIHGYVLVYSVTSRTSFEMVKIIREKLLNMTGTNSVPIVLVGNKTDLHLERVVSYEDGKALAAEWGCQFLESSAKHNQSVREIFEAIIFAIEKNAEPPTKKEDGGCVLL